MESSRAQNQPVAFVTLDPSFQEIIGQDPRFALLASSDESLPLFHEACIYHSPTKSVFVTSNQIPTPPEQPSPSTANKTVKLFRIYDSPGTGPGEEKARVEDVTPSSLANSMLNGGVNYSNTEILLCAQGSKSATDSSGLILLPIDSDPTFSAHSTIISSFHGRPFNSVNDVIIHPNDGSIWFTDPCYGHHQGIRNAPQLPNQVYRFDPKTNSIRAVADGFVRPNGLCFSPDLSTLYVTDTGCIHGSSQVPIDPAGPSHIYAFDIVSRDGSSHFLANRRLFAYADGGWPDGIKCDLAGNVYSGCGDGIEVWNPNGDLIGRILVEGGVANFCFGESGAMYLCNETRLWKVQLGQHVKGALLRI